MFTMDDAAQLLNSKGFQAQVIDGAVEICTESHEDYEKMRRILKKAGYNGSYGWTMKHDEIDGKVY